MSAVLCRLSRWLSMQGLMLPSNVDSGGALFPRSPQTSTICTVLTEETHLPCIVKNFINGNLCQSDEASAQRENIWALYKSITQVVKKICSHAIWIGCGSAGKGMDLFLRGWRAGCSETPSKTGHAVHITKPQSQTNVLFKEPKRCLLQSASLLSPLPLLPGCALCVQHIRLLRASKEETKTVLTGSSPLSCKGTNSQAWG